MTVTDTPAGDDMSSLAPGTVGNGGVGGGTGFGGGGDGTSKQVVLPSGIAHTGQSFYQKPSNRNFAQAGISHEQIDNDFDQETGIGNNPTAQASHQKKGLWASLSPGRGGGGGGGPSKTVTGATSFDQAGIVDPTVITNRGSLRPNGTGGTTSQPRVSSRDLPLPDDTYDDTFKQLVTKNRTTRRLRPYRKRWRRVIIVSIVSICFIAFALTIGIYFGLKQQEASIRGNSGTATTQSTTPSNMCCSRDQFVCAEDLRNLCANEQTCISTCQAFWITPTTPPASAPPPTGCCSLDGGITCEGSIGGGGGGVNGGGDDTGGGEIYYGSSNTNNYNNATLSQLCNSNQQTCEANGECLGGTWIPYCCTTDGRYCDLTETQPQCDVDANTCTSGTCGGLSYGPYQVKTEGGCCSYDGGVTCGTVRDGKAQQCDLIPEECHFLCSGVYKTYKQDGCCSRDGGISCDHALPITTKDNSNRLPDFCDESQASCEITCGGTFKLPLPPVTQQQTTSPTPAPVLTTLPPSPSVIDMTQQIKTLLIESGVSTNNVVALDKDNVTGLAFTPQSRALQWISMMDTYTKGLIDLLPNSGVMSIQTPMEVNQTIIQRFGLAVLFFSSTNLPQESWINTQGWLSPTDHCTWYGIACSDGNNMNGTTTNTNGTNDTSINSSVGRQAGTSSGTTLHTFQLVAELSLGNNNLRGSMVLQHPEIYRSLGNSLTTLDLRDNMISGSFGGSEQHEDALQSLSELKTLSLFNNSLDGTISTYIGSLTKLEKLYMEYNQFQGQLPTQIGYLMNIQRMDIHSNKLVGPIPKEIGFLANLERLWLSNNLLNGTLPIELSNCQSLIALYLDQNMLSGSIFPTIENLTNLEDVRLYQNQFNGTLPSTLNTLSKLQILYLDNNNLVGTLPNGYPTTIEELSLYNNTLVGTLPSTLATQSYNLRTLTLSNNQFNSTIPNEFNLLTNLNVLHLQNNSLTGQISTNNLPSNTIRDLFLQHNSLQGTIPQLVYNYTRVNLSHNNFNGNLTPVPAGGGSYQIQSLQLEGNPLLGRNAADGTSASPIPAEVCTNLPNLQTLTVSCTNNIGINGNASGGGGFTSNQLQSCVTCV